MPRGRAGIGHHGRVQMDIAAAVALVRPTDSIAVPLGPGVPGGFLHALGARTDFVDLQMFGALLPDLYELFTRSGVHYRSGFFGPAERFLRDSGASVDFVPADFRRFQTILHDLAPRVMATAAAPPVDGWVSLSLHAGASIPELRKAGADPDRLLVVEVSPHFPRTMGVAPEHMHRFHVDEIDVLIETDRMPFELADAPPTDAERAIAEFATRYVHDGCTLQTGIGGIPSQVAKLLADGPSGDFGIHSEMFTTGLMHLHRAGKVTNRKSVSGLGRFDGFSVTTFAAGVRELYEWLHDNDQVRFLPVDIVNSPELIAENRDMVTINGALSVDLAGQVVADTIIGKQFSGIGGHEDFVGAPTLSDDGRSLICLPSTSTVAGELVNRVLAKLPYGSIISTPRHQVDIVITEFGVAELQGRTVRERARALAAIAHPQFRDELVEAALNWPVD
ncbi:MAG: putative 4-hydroxybutyrate CoA-transferase AbfT [Ilumatobacteraceae bacterium]|nr:putative 4-hydroxybutyrate CoA-transferase AbfT [Ilumatobacteraceae bacterium]